MEQVRAICWRPSIGGQEPASLSDHLHLHHPRRGSRAAARRPRELRDDKQALHRLEHRTQAHSFPSTPARRTMTFITFIMYAYATIAAAVSVLFGLGQPARKWWLYTLSGLLWPLTLPVLAVLRHLGRGLDDEGRGG